MDRKTKIFIRQREKESLLKKLNDLEGHRQVSLSKNIFWTCFTLFVVNPLITFGIWFSLYKQFKGFLHNYCYREASKKYIDNIA